MKCTKAPATEQHFYIDVAITANGRPIFTQYTDIKAAYKFLKSSERKEIIKIGELYK